MKFRSKPSVVEAIQWTGDNGAECAEFASDKVRVTDAHSADPLLTLMAGKGGAQEWVPVPVGHWLVSPPDDRSDVWPVEAVYFAAKYELDEDRGITFVDPMEFISFGYLQEANRLFFHPHGLALEMCTSDDGSHRISGVWDYRTDPEGMYFGEGVLQAEKAERVAAELERRSPEREAILGYVIQPLP